VENPFFALVPLGWGRWLLIGLSILATIIASQAMISGTCSISRQAMQLGYFPRLHVVHTSAEQEGQIYIPALNWLLAFGCLAIIFVFKSSNALAAAYGVAVTGTFLVTTIAYYRVAVRRYRWKRLLALICLVFLAVDAVFFASNLTKLGHGGFFPLILGMFFLAAMHTWWRGRQEVVEQIRKQTVDAEVIIGELKEKRIHRVSGTAVFMAASPTGTPIVLLHHLKANQCLHETVILLSLINESVPRVKKADRYQAEDLGEGVYRVIAHYGYLEFPQVPPLLEWVKEKEGLKLNLRRTTYYFNRETILTDGTTGLWRWQKHLFRFLSETAQSARDFFGIPSNQIIEIGLPRQL
jgi:KUP system potassium uptake protein